MPTQIISIPGSKSLSNRALIIRMLCNNYFKIHNLSTADDTQVLNKILMSDSNNIDVGHAGTVMRFVTAFASQIFGEWFITGSERIKQRPVKELVNALRELGAEIHYKEKEGLLPLRIVGTMLKGKELHISASISSQFISALMLIAPRIMGGLTIILDGEIVSRSYIEMTKKVMENFGVNVRVQGNTIFIPECSYKEKEFTVEADWSSASYWYSIAVLSDFDSIILQGLKKSSWQGDSVIAEIFEPLGIKTKSVKEGVTLIKDRVTTLNFKYDFTDCPDLAQTLAVCLVLMKIPYTLTGLSTLKNKETDRIAALKKELSKLGAILKITNNSITWDGTIKNAEAAPEIETYQDHRMAMAFASAVIKYPDIKINNPEVVSKSYPDFWEHFKKILSQNL
ncbi:MAG: hypothetical protein A2491_14965 [Bacteroidetes bacterium RIFOXYC12_FULL_35_7]|nr:MAG: hypothetical protein A2491_14965 [Bacteroidetes bacterium RIFOXYC12_FULL_35_7]